MDILCSKLRQGMDILLNLSRTHTHIAAQPDTAMNLNLVYLRRVVLFLLSVPFCLAANAQNFSFNCARDTVIPGCTPNPCFTVRTTIPDIYSSSASYTVSKASPLSGSACTPIYHSPYTAGTPTNLFDDDIYGGVVPLGFNFPFFGNIYNSLVVSTNGLVSFDLTRANQGSHYGILNAGGLLSAQGGTPQNLPSTLYDPSIIMGIYHDVDITIQNSINRKIEYTTVGAAPNRKWIITFFELPLYNCPSSYSNTSQIILNEGTGIIEVTIYNKETCISWNEGRAMVGIQNGARNQAYMAPGRRASDAPWQGMGLDETWRFTPSAGSSLLKRVELLDINGNVVSNTPTLTVQSDGTRAVAFPNICPPAGATTSYIVRAVYQKFDDAAVEVAGYDTIRVTRGVAADLGATATATNSACGGTGTGTITAQVPAGSGTGSYEYSITSAAGPWQAGGQFQNVAPGSYTVYVRDGGGCTSAVPVTVNASGAWPVTFTTTASSCPGAYNGTITVNANGSATTQYQLNFGPAWQSSNVFSGLPGGTHFISIRDLTTGCTVTGTPVTVATGTSNVTGTAVATPTSCAGLNNGSITVTPNGTGPFQYSLNGGGWQNSASFTNLAPGNYSVVIREAGACTSSPINVNVAAGSGLNPTITTTASSCAGVNNGQMSISLPAGTAAPYTIVVDGNTYTTSASPFVIPGLAAGNHTVTVTDNNGCTTSTPVSVTIATGTGFTATGSASGTSCNGVSDGSVTVTPSATATAPFTYLLMPGNITQTSSTPASFGGLAPGTYSVRITDANGCQYTVTNQAVAAGSGLNATVTATPSSCAGVNNGQLSITLPAGSIAPYTIVVDGNTHTANASPAIITGLAAGNHSVTVTDNTGCTTSSAIAVTITAGAGFTATGLATATSCNGQTDGTITITPSAAATAPYTYVLQPGNLTQTISAPANFGSLAPGTYSVQVTDANGCQYTVANQVVATGAGLAATLTPTAASCTGVNNGSIVVNTNGTAPFTFVLNGTVSQNTPTFNNLAPGNYSVTVTDVNGCSTPAAVTTTVGVSAGISASHSSTAVSCNGGTDGGINVSIVNTGIAPYTFILNGTVTQSGAAAASFGGLPAGNAYTIQVIDAVGCTYTITGIEVTEPAALLATTTVSSVLCNAAANGSIQVNATGGNGGYTYSLNNGAFQPASSFQVAAGTYSVTVRDARGCTITLNNIVVNEPPILQASVASVSNATCNGGADGQVQVTASGGTAPYTYSLDGSNFQSSATLGANPGTYAVVVRDANGCTVAAGTAVVGLTNNLTITPMTDPAPICEGRSVQLQVQTNGNQFSWTPAASLSQPAIANPLASPASTTLYTVQVSLGRCTASDDVQVTVLPAPVPNAGNDITICYGQSTQLHGSGGVSYTWSPDSFLSSLTESDPLVVNPTATTTYSLSVVDANNCSSLVADQVTVTVTPPIRITVTPADTIVYAGASVPLLASSAATSYTWTPAAGLNNASVANPVLTAPGVGQNLTLRVVGSTAAGCRGEAYVTVRVYDGPEIYLPNAFTPNGDGLNDRFMAQPVGIKQLKYLRIYNRAGRLLYSTSQMGAGWDGRYQGQDQPMGVYVWQCQGITDDGKLITRQGTVTLVR